MGRGRIILEDLSIDLVIPSFDETLIGWAQSLYAVNRPISSEVLLSPSDVIQTFVDKWKAYRFFTAHNIQTPATSLKQVYPLVKPRFGRGGRGVQVIHEPVDMNGMISQQIVTGEEFTVDVLCDNNSKPIYIVPRKRLVFATVNLLKVLSFNIVALNLSLGNCVQRQDFEVPLTSNVFVILRIILPLSRLIHVFLVVWHSVLLLLKIGYRLWWLWLLVRVLLILYP